MSHQDSVGEDAVGSAPPGGEEPQTQGGADPQAGSGGPRYGAQAGKSGGSEIFAGPPWTSRPTAFSTTASPPPAKKSGCRLAALICGGFFSLIFFGVLLSVLLGGWIHGDGWRAAAPEEYIEGEGTDKIALISARGAIFDEPGGLFGGGVRESLVQRLVCQLRQAGRDESVKAVVLCVDSPGGGVTASDQIWREVKNLKDARGGVKVVVHMGDLCASGGYYISAPADAIIASPTTTTGSIGVIATCLDLSELLERKLGIREQTIKSGRLKDMFSASRPMTEEERQIIQEIIDSMHERFVRIVAEGRKGRKGIPEDMEGAVAAVKKIADGRVYTAEQAEKLGLVDGIGYLDDAIAEAKKLAGLKEATVVRYGERKGLLAILSGKAELPLGIGPVINLNADALARRMAPRLEYRWAPLPFAVE